LRSKHKAFKIPKHESKSKQSTTNIAKALITFHLKVEKVKKDATNPFFKKKYASLSNILEAIDGPLNESGLSFSQFPTNQNGLTTILMHGESGEYLQDTYEMNPVKDDPQGRGSALTYQRRYALAAILGLNIDEDDDGNTASKSVNQNNNLNKKPLGKPQPKSLSEDELFQWQQSVNACINLDEITALYNKNKGTVNSEPQVFEMFKSRKKQLS
jgi:hypothetical protein